MASVKNAIAFSFLGKYLKIIIQLAGTMILTRTLAPEDYGLYTIAYIFVVFTEILREFGVSNYLIKEKELTPEKISSAFALLLISSSIFAPILYFSAYPIAEFYGNDKLIVMLQLLSINVLLTPFGSIVRSMLVRNLDFKGEMVASLSSQILSICLMIYLASQGYEELTLVFGAIALTFFDALLIQLYRPKNLPKLPSLRKIKDVFHYSKFVGLASIFGQLGHYASELVVGKYFSMHAVGQLNRASNTASLFNKLVSDALAPVITPYISQLSREKQDIIPKVQLLTNIQLNLAWPFYAVIAILSEPVIVILFGEAWAEAAIYLSLYCVSRFLFSLIQHINPIMMGLGHAKPIMKAELILNTLRICIILATAKYGIVTMLLATTAVMPFTRICYFLVLINKYLGISFSDYLKPILGPLFSTALTILPVVLISVYYDFQLLEQLLHLSISLMFSLMLWVLIIWKQPLGLQIKKLVSK